MVCGDSRGKKAKEERAREKEKEGEGEEDCAFRESKKRNGRSFLFVTTSKTRECMRRAYEREWKLSKGNRLARGMIYSLMIAR